MDNIYTAIRTLKQLTSDFDKRLDELKGPNVTMGLDDARMLNGVLKRVLRLLQRVSGQ